VVVDAGAAYGVFSARMAQLVGPQGQVHAFEPNPDNLEYLRAVASTEPNVAVHEVALSDRSGSAVLHVPLEDGRRESGLGSLAPPRGATAASVAVQTARLDDVLDREVAFIKCDVEGHELAVLRGAERTLAEARPTLLVEIERRHAGDRMDATFEYLAELGYAAFAIGPEGPLPLDRFDLERDQLAHLDDRFESREMPPGYINDFLFTPPRAPPPQPRCSAGRGP
jgi:FkbM family methyltransferase